MLETNDKVNETPRSSALLWATGLLALGLACALGLSAYLHAGMSGMRTQLSTMQREIAMLRQSVAEADGATAQQVTALKQELQAARQETVESTKVVRKEAATAASRQAKLVAEKWNKAQEEQSRQLEAKLNEIRNTNEQASARLTDISTEVGAVKTEVASTRGDVQKIAADLHRTTGDLGVMSGLIATNSRELAALRELGERDYVEFRVPKAKEAMRIGDISVRLKKADVKRNRYSLDLVADDKLVEKKDRGINEPVQFYVLSKARQPFEIVVNEVRKDEIVGYLAVPKVKLVARK